MLFTRILILLICSIHFLSPLVQPFVFKTRYQLHRPRCAAPMDTLQEPVCNLDKVLRMFLSNANLTAEIKQKRFSQSVRYRKKPLPSYLSPDDELILADIKAEALFCNKSIFFTNISMGSSLEVFDEKYDSLSFNRSLPELNDMLRRFYETFTGLPSSGLELRIQNMNYLFKALIYSESRTKCIALQVRTLDEVDAMLYKRVHCGEIQPIVEKIFHEKKVRKIGAKKLKAMEEARKAEERREKKKSREMLRKTSKDNYQSKRKAQPGTTEGGEGGGGDASQG